MRTYAVYVGHHEGHVCLNIHALPYMLPLAHLPMTADEATILASSLVDAAVAIEPAAVPPEPRYRIQVRRLDAGGVGEMWTYTCPAHEDAGIGLWHDLPAAHDAAVKHYTLAHS